MAAAPQQRVASLIDNYFVTSSAQPHTWAYGKVNEVTGFASHARVNVPSDTTTIEEFGESLRRHPKVLRVEAKRNHQSDFNWKVWMVGNRVDIMGYSKFQDQEHPGQWRRCRRKLKPCMGRFRSRPPNEEGL